MPDHSLSRRDLIAAGASGAALLSASSFPLTSVDEEQSALVTERLPVAERIA